MAVAEEKGHAGRIGHDGLFGQEAVSRCTRKKQKKGIGSGKADTQIRTLKAEGREGLFVEKQKLLTAYPKDDRSEPPKEKSASNKDFGAMLGSGGKKDGGGG